MRIVNLNIFLRPIIISFIFVLYISFLFIFFSNSALAACGGAGNAATCGSNGEPCCTREQINAGEALNPCADGCSCNSGTCGEPPALPAATSTPVPTSTPTPTSGPTATPTQPPSPTPTPAPVPGDMNDTGCVDLLDFNIWLEEYLLWIGRQTTTSRGDTNKDSWVDIVDYNIWFMAMMDESKRCPTPTGS